MILFMIDRNLQPIGEYEEFPDFSFHLLVGYLLLFISIEASCCTKDPIVRVDPAVFVMWW